MSDKATETSKLLRVLTSVPTLILLCTGTTAVGAVVFQLENLTVASYSIPSYGVTVGTAVFSASADTVAPVALTSSSPGVASVPPSVPVVPPNDRVTFPVRAVSAGCATVTAAYKTRSRERRVVVHPPNSGATFALSVPDQIIPMGGRVQAKITTGGTGSAEFAVVSTRPMIASVPSRVEVGRGSGSFEIAALREGCSIITATFRGQTVGKTVQVVYIGG